MQGKIGDSIMIIGNASKDAEFKHVGEKQTPNAKFGVAIGKDKDGNGIFVNCETWRRLAYIASEIKKGDVVLVIGKIEEHEYNGKVYRTLVADWIDVKGSTRAAQQPVQVAQAPAPEPEQPSQDQNVYNLNKDDEDLPF